MKKILMVFTLITVLTLTACEGFQLPSDIDITLPSSDISTNLNTTEIISETQTTTESVSSTQTITTIINDDIYLQLNIGQDTVEINSEWIDKGALFVLNDQEFPMTTDDLVAVNTLGLYKLTYHYTYMEEDYELIRYVVVVDQTPPEISLNLGVDTIKVGDTWVDEGVTIQDNSNENISAIVSGYVNTDIPGTYEIIYTAEDSSGNVSSIKRYVTVIE
jgi:hypothetical protein